MKIAIVGMGCSGTLVLRALSENLQSSSNIELLLFEQTPDMGAGLPYGRQFNDDSFILNMESSLLGANQDDPGEFSTWLQQNTIEESTTGYSKRLHIGRYLAEVVQASLVKLRKKGINYSIVQDAVTDIQQDMGTYQLITQQQLHQANNVILAVGHLPKVSPFPSASTYIANPYHALSAITNIPKSSRVGILGSKLTAVDIALLLNKHGMKTIAMFSKSGLLPYVRQGGTTPQLKFEPTSPSRHTLQVKLTINFKKMMFETV
jgi:uncharacterized NAD(P)/FAD-binding protein YdhS